MAQKIMIPSGDERDPLDILTDAINKGKEQRNRAPFFLSLKDGEKVLVRPMVPLGGFVLIECHEVYNQAAHKFDVSAVCARSYGQDCQHCLDAASTKNWKLKAEQHFLFPMYVHRMQRLQSDNRTWVDATYKDERGVEQLTCGIRVLDAKRSSPILASWKDAYDETRLFEGRDWVIIRRSKDNYSITMRPDTSALPADLVVPSSEKIKSDLEMLRPMKVVGEEAGGQAPDISDDTFNDLNTPF